MISGLWELAPQLIVDLTEFYMFLYLSWFI